MPRATTNQPAVQPSPIPPELSAMEQLEKNITSPMPVNSEPVNQAAAASPRRNVVEWFTADGDDLPVSLPDGRRVIITATPRPIPPAFYREAAKAGAISTAADRRSLMIPDTPPEFDPVRREGMIRNAIMVALRGNAEDPEFADAFTPSGLPNSAWLSKRVGFEVSPTERTRLWGQMKELIDAEAGADGDEDD